MLNATREWSTAHSASTGPSEDDLAGLLLIRHFELALLRLFGEGRISGTTHTCLGQEHVPVALAPLLRDDDFVFSNHRGHGHYLARTGDADGLLAEVMGRQGAVCGGVGGSQHLYTDGYLSTGVQGESLPVAVGMALAGGRRDSGGLVLAFVGDGTWGEGAVYEALNLASLWRLPVVVVVENNGIAQSTPTAANLAGSIGARAAAFDVAFHRTEEGDAGPLRAELAPLLAAVREGSGPLVVEVMTRRLGPHSKGDDTRTDQELARLREADWYVRHARDLPERFAAQDVAQRARVERLAAEISARPLSDGRAAPRAGERRAAERRAVERPAGERDAAARPAGHAGGRASERVGENLNRALHELMAADPTVHLLGEDVADPYGGAFRITRGLSSRFGDRVRSTPISEGAIVGVGAGLALGGEKAVVEMMFGDFVTLAFDQLVNFAAKSVSMYGRRVPVPLLVRCPVGGRRGYGPTHSQSPQKHLLGVPDLTLLELSPFHDAVPLLRRAMALGNPVVLFEDKILYTARRHGGELLEGLFAVRLEGAAPQVAVVGPEGVTDHDAVLIAPGGMAHRAVEAMRTLLIEDELCCRLLVPAQLYPLDPAELAGLCGGAKRVLVLEDGTGGGSWGSTVAHALYPELWRTLDAPIRVLSAADRVVPAAPHLEQQVFVQPEGIRRAVLAAVADAAATTHRQGRTG